MKPIDPAKKIETPSSTIPVEKKPATKNSPGFESLVTTPAQHLEAKEVLASMPETIIEGLKQPIAKLAVNFKRKKEELLRATGPELTDQDQKDYYTEIKSSLSPKENKQIDEVVETFHNQPLSELSGEDIVLVLRKKGKAKIGDRDINKIQDDSLSSDGFPQDLKAKLKEDVKRNFGSYVQRTRSPLLLLSELQQEVEDVLKETIEELKDPRFSVLGHGSFGVVAKVEEGDFKAILKLPISLDDTEFIEDFKQELDALRSYQERTQYPLVEIPELIYDKDGKEVAQRGVYMMKKFQEGESLMMLNQKTALASDQSLKADPGEWSKIDVYTKEGLSDEFLSQYLGFYTEYAQNGISLDDIRFYNYYYKADTQSLSFFEIGINGDLPDTRERKELNLENPLGAAIFSLMSHVACFEPKLGYPAELRKNIELRAKEDWGREDIFRERIEQAKRVVNDFIASDSNDFSVEDLKKGLEFLKNTDSQYFELTEQGYQYLDEMMKDLV